MARRVGLVVVGYLGLGAIWAFLSAYYFNAVTLPPPSAVLSYMWDLAVSGAAFTNFASSIGKIVAGFAIGTLIGAPIGLLMGRSQYWKNFWLRPILTIGIFFGLGAKGPILAVTLVALPFVALNVMEGVEGVDERLVHMSKVYGRRSMDITRSVFIPTVAPFLFAALRYGFAMAWKVEALTEVFGGKSGIGFMIRAEYNAFSVVGVLAWTGFFVIFMLIIERLVLARLEHWVFAWRGVA
jgi:NitT/TauT family transport system permease protein